MPMDELYGFKVEGNVPTAGARKRMEQEAQQEQVSLQELQDRVTMLEAENNNIREVVKALEREIRMLANKVATI